MNTSAGMPTHEEIEARVDNWLNRTGDSARRFGDGLRGLAFFVYLFFAFLSFWLWFVGAIFFVVRAIPFLIARVFLTLSDGIPDVEEEPDLPVGERLQRHGTRAWNRRDLVYERFKTPVARNYLASRHAVGRFWRWGMGRKLAFLIATLFLFVLPLAYVVPRPIYVQVVDDNAINVDSDGVTRYLVHGVGLYNLKTYELRNDAWWPLLKFNPQGLQNRLQAGRYYRMWIVGIRWWVPPLFPNIIGATEVDANGKKIGNPVPFVPPSAPGGLYPKGRTGA
jgi:hypothetical protein